MNEPLNVGKINLEEYLQRRKVPVKGGNVFKVLQIECSFFEKTSILIDFGNSLDEQESVGGYFSLLLGKNGTCKSSLLRELIEFIIDAHLETSRRRKSHVKVFSVKYSINGKVYEIRDFDGTFLYFIDGVQTTSNQISFPLIVSSTMGLFDKFPVNNASRSDIGRYKYKYYHYVGPKASNNIISSKANVLLQQISALPSISHKNQLNKLDTVLKFIGYDSKIVFEFNPNDSNPRKNEETLASLSNEQRNLWGKIIAEDYRFISIKTNNTTLTEVRRMPLSELNVLRQNGLLRNFKCFLFKQGQKIDCSFLSSGEFNLLCIVISVVLAANSQSLLILLDEPEISQHPNWQLDLIPNLEKSLVDYGCHFIIATHCHFLVSNLPIKRSNVICMSREDGDVITVENIPSETYGWSAEEVLLKAFNVPTDRSRYLAEEINLFLKRIGEKQIEKNDVEKKLKYFKEITSYLSSYDPMKKILDIIIKQFS